LRRYTRGNAEHFYVKVSSMIEFDYGAWVNSTNHKEGKEDVRTHQSHSEPTEKSC